MTSKISACLRAAAIVTMVSLFGLQTAWAQSARFVAMERLESQAAQQGKVRVIVALDVPTRAEPTLSPAEVAAQRAAIAQSQASVTARAAPLRVNVLERFETVPYMVAEVDPNGLAALRASPLVKDLHEDELAQPGMLQSNPVIRAPDVWNTGNTGTGWAVAVLDTGVERTHPFLNGKVVSEACYSTNASGVSSLCPGGVTSSTATGAATPCTDLCSHGTHVAGTAAGGTRASDGSHGVAYGANVIAIQVFSRFLNYSGAGKDAVLAYSSDIMKGLERVYALRNTYQIAAVNMSLGGGQYSTTCDSDPRKPIIDNLRAAGIATVISAGNSGWRTEMGAPGCISSAISVAASCDVADSGTCATGVRGITSYSNVTSFVSLVAPGSYITSSVVGGGYATYNGTSMAAPHVAGAWALIKRSQPSISVTDALSRFRTHGIAMNDTRSGGSVTGLRHLDLGFLGASVTTYTLTVAKSGTAASSGTVTSSPSGINCGSDCTEPYASGTSVTLTATAGSGAVFAGWSGACSGTASTCTVSMSAARAVTATFNAQTKYTLTVTKAGTAASSGTVTSSPSGINCGSDCTEPYNSGTSVTLSAAAGSGAVFAGWSGACSGTASTCTVSMSAARAVTATFNAQTKYTLTVTKAGTGASSGTVTSSPAGINCGSDCTEPYNSGTSVTLSAAAGSGAVFAGWSGACSGTASTCTVSMSAARAVTATFNAQTKYTLTVTKAGTAASSGTVSSSPAGINCGSDCSEPYNSGTSVTLTATAGSGAVFAGWSGACSGTARSCTVAMSAARSVTATFNPRYTLTVTKSGTAASSGTVSSSPAGINCGSDCTEPYNSGTSVTLTATASNGAVFAGWSGACSGTASTCTVSMTAARAVTATFNPRYTLTVTKSGTAASSGTVSSSPAGINCGSDCTEPYNSGTSVRLTATAGSGAVFAGWSGGACSGTASTCTVSMSAARSTMATFNRR